MASLTEDQQRAFGDRITEIYNKPETATAVAASDKGLDLTKRKTALGTQQTAAAKAEGSQTAAKAALTAATEASVAATTTYYKEASNAAEALITELGEDHALGKQIRGLRGGMVNIAARGPSTPPKP
jgi:hypothetical protein